MGVETTPADLRDALLGLALVAAGFARGKGKETARAKLRAALAQASRTLREADAAAPKPATDDLRRMADEADADARARRGFRQDWEG